MRGIAILFLAAAAMPAQTAPAAFEVASVKPTAHGRTNGVSISDAKPVSGGFEAQNSSLFELITFAYNLKDFQVVGPKWLNHDEESFDIVAKAPAGASRQQIRGMVQTLLAERFHLAAHRETRTLPVYSLVTEKGGAKLQQTAAAGEHTGVSSGGGKLTATHYTMADFANELSRNLKRPVFDRTGIAGAFDFVVLYGEQRGVDRGPIETAIRDQLGLRLETAKGPVEVLVVDRIDKAPTRN